VNVFWRRYSISGLYTYLLYRTYLLTRSVCGVCGHVGDTPTGRQTFGLWLWWTQTEIKLIQNSETNSVSSRRNCFISAVAMQLIKSKCVPVLLYAVDACPINRTLECSLQFPLTRIMMKIFKTNSKKIINSCQLYFGLHPISDAIKKRKINFLNKISTTCNALCKLFVSTASSELISLCSAT